MYKFPAETSELHVQGTRMDPLHYLAYFSWYKAIAIFLFMPLYYQYVLTSLGMSVHSGLEVRDLLMCSIHRDSDL